MADKATSSISVSVLKDTLKANMSGSLVYEPADTSEKWVYTEKLIGTASEPLITAGDAYIDEFAHTSAPTAVHADDVYRWLAIKNTGTSDTSGTTTTNSVYVSLDTTAAAYNALDNIEIKSGEAWMGNIAGPLMQSIFIISAQARGAATAATVNSSTSVRCTVAAIVEDVA